ncbi:BTB/POZ domain-containing protein [Ditylenchus destructor]|uniref:BTB/POZ domain-containing protein n=1 Tax=Ditylenchus destructor TaxID=166010 RepID=A0AAD4MTZ2_9BILA|nr:BTB/POZ domain-containing protein [Ditylenchus destructor]
MSDYTEFVIAAEDELAGPQGRKICLYNAIWESSEVSSSGIAAVSCKKLLPEIETCHAEVLFISSGATINKRVWKHFKVGDSVATAGWNDSVVIRALEEKQKILKEFDSRSAADVTFVVNDEECIGDRKLLAAVSPVFNAMLYGKFAEAQQDRIVLEGIESAEIFKDFLLAVSPLRIQPNPSNVTALLKLAHQYDIPFLARNCEDHLMHCYEISSIDRLFLAEKYGLNALKLRITHGLKYSSR